MGDFRVDSLEGFHFGFFGMKKSVEKLVFGVIFFFDEFRDTVVVFREGKFLVLNFFIGNLSRGLSSQFDTEF